MKKFLFLSAVAGLMALAWTACKKSNYPGGQVNTYIPLFDLKNLYKGSDLVLDAEAMFGSTAITGLVVSDHSGGNLPEGLLVLQDRRRLNVVRGISIALGADAAKFVIGDSIAVKMEGKTLTRRDGILQITGVTMGDITKLASNRAIPKNPVASSLILAKPFDYESTHVIVVDAVFDPIAKPADTYSGDKTINDGFDNFTLRTRANAKFANTSGLNFAANYSGIVFNTVNANGVPSPYLAIRTMADVKPLSSEPELAAAVITGYMADAQGGDGNYEYMQFLATEDINFAVTPYSVVVTNNAGGSSPTGVAPTKGWATGADAARSPVGLTARTYKFNLTSGTVSKGEFFYVGGSSRLINGSGSTSIASSKWIRAKNYTTATPANNPAGNGDGFGLYTTNLFANSGNASGFAIFKGTEVNVNSTPIDCIFIGGGGNIYSTSPLMGYRVARNDLYKRIEPIEGIEQLYYRSGTNTMSMQYQLPSDQGFFNKLGGIYNPAIGRWKKARSQNDIDLEKNSTLAEIEGIHLKLTRDANGAVVRTDTIAPTRLVN
ncbi:DUF5689 domain-containing protein [Pedobacter sp. SYP-B3415]|uniref:DUF5689 domain-containing protein n=1 Tax=Pedobacter sp. SYP-B3415 TaxID=2496641 RepID=UPI00101BC8FD|nr:DUF5689 domain-containing protein [Pedobacter sp. SYP-B3415]